VSEALDEVRDELGNGRQSPNLVALLEEHDARLRALESDKAESADETPEGGE
jgi:hypothetical protein